MARAGEELVNPITGERIVFLKTSADTGGALLEMDACWTRPGHRAPEHVHPEMQERFEVITGTARFRIAGVEQTRRSGAVAVAEPGVPHLAWNPTEESVRVRIQMRPALRWERFVEQLFALAGDAHARGLDMPDPASLAELLRQFPQEIATAPEPR
ncbi:MAG TPA: cupin domain-containing protein [Solirubrobacteraceae bacterium]|nr:cupin domain-containing protein [Solirubrobacteraceae bacterium]